MQRMRNWSRQFFYAGFLFLWITTLGYAEEGVQARVGIKIKSGDTLSRAKTHDRIKVGDSLQLYVIPNEKAYVYVIYTDGTDVQLLNSKEADESTPADTPIILPAHDKYYTITPGSSIEHFTVICSPKELERIEKAFRRGKVSSTEWNTLEKALFDRGSATLREEIPKPMPIAGNTRSVNLCDFFCEQLQQFAGTPTLIKKYEFKVAQ